MRHSPSPHFLRPPQASAAAAGDAGVNVWLLLLAVTLPLTLACRACRLALRSIPALLRLLFIALVYLALAAMLLAAVLAMLAFHSIACISSNVP